MDAIGYEQDSKGRNGSEETLDSETEDLKWCLNHPWVTVLSTGRVIWTHTSFQGGGPDSVPLLLHLASYCPRQRISVTVNFHWTFHSRSSGSIFTLFSAMEKHFAQATITLYLEHCNSCINKLLSLHPLLAAFLCLLSTQQIEIVCVYVCVCVLTHLSHVQLFVALCTIAYQAPLSVGFSRQDYWSGLLCSYLSRNISRCCSTLQQIRQIQDLQSPMDVTFYYLLDY